MPQYKTDDTITAIATPPGEGGIAVIRVSGPEAVAAAEKIFKPHKGDVKEFASHTAHFGSVLNDHGAVIDQALLTVFRAPHSYTGEDVVELSVHGGIVVARQILARMLGVNARPAEPGEFTRRAFLNGKMDLTQAEAVLDLIRARSEKSAEVAIKQLTGELSAKLKSLKDRLMNLYAHLEAYIDFPDEHLEVYEDQDFIARFETLREEISGLAASFKRGSLIKEGIGMPIIGKPNVGKSSLFNALLARDRALVSEYPGTTRDILEENIDIGGYLIRLTDTAGLLRQTEHPLDQMGIERTRLAVKSGMIFLFVADGSAALDEEDRAAFGEIVKDRTCIVVISKSDLPKKISESELKTLTGAERFIHVSVKDHSGLEELEQEIQGILEKEKNLQEGEQITRLRHKTALERSLQSLENAQRSFRDKESLDIVAIDFKTALDELRELIGEVYSEDLLDVIFSEFCIGK